MIRKITLLFLACLGISSLSMAQKCGTDAYNQQMMLKDPAFANDVNQFNANLAAWITAQKNKPQALVTTFNGNLAWEIPVVVHVIHLTGTGHAIGQTFNPSTATITNFVNYLSQAFTASYTGHLLESNGGTRIPIVFKLAQRDPNGAATTGIIRIDKSADLTYLANGVGTPGIPDATLKGFSYWPNTEYYNIWVVYKIDGANASSGPGPYTAGYAQYPTGGISLTDGTVVLADQVAVGNSVITHELGHAFGLYHVFNGGSTTACPPAPDDFVTDTEPIRQSPFNCPVDPNPCPPFLYNNTQKNFMDYSNCKDRFTPGQRVRVYAALQNLSVAIPSLGTPTVRTSLISSLGATPPSAMPAVSCSPPTNAVPLNNLGLRAVTIQKQGGVDTIIMNAISGSNQTDGTHYYDRSQEHRAELKAGATYRFRVTVGNTFESVVAWIDYNNDGVFTSPSEVIFSGTDNNTHNFQNFTVPATGAVNCVPIRMRVITNTNNPCQPNYGGQCEDYQVVIRGSGGLASTPGLATIIKPPFEGNPSCLGSGVTVAATYQNTITPVAYRWFRKLGTPPYTVTDITNLVPPATGADSFVFRNNWNNLDTVWAKVAYPGLCGIDTTITDSITLFRPITVTPTVTIGITKGTNPGCPDDTVRFTVTSNVNPGPNPDYHWFQNGSPVGANQPFYETFNITSGSTFQVRMDSKAPLPCAAPGFANSNIITYTHTTKAPTLSIALISGTNPGCPNQALSFKATGTTTGLTPTYTWFVNSIQVQTGGSNTYTAVLNNNDVVSCTMLSSTSCAVPSTATSNNTITITHTPLIADVTIQQISGNSPACTGHWMVFVATPTNSGANPQFQWMINNAPVTNANSPIFSTKSLLNGDFVSCILISTDPCVQNTFDTSAILPMVITTSKSPTLTVAITAGNNPGCLDSLVEFTATETNLGVSPNFDWLVNNFQTFNGQVFSTSNLLNGDVVVCRANQTDNGCYLPDTVFSAPVTMVRSVTPAPPIISLVNSQLVTNKTGSFVWFGPGGQLVGGENGSFHPTELGQYYCVTNNNGCWSKPSNKLTITLLDISTYNINQVNIFPNPTTGQVVLDWGGHNVTMKVGIYSTVGQKLMETNVVKQARKTLDLGKLANGVYFVVITDEQGHSGTARITVTK